MLPHTQVLFASKTEFSLVNHLGNPINNTDLLKIMTRDNTVQIHVFSHFSSKDIKDIAHLNFLNVIIRHFLLLAQIKSTLKYTAQNFVRHHFQMNEECPSAFTWVSCNDGL